jgi:hypothetical protein
MKNFILITFIAVFMFMSCNNQNDKDVNAKSDIEKTQDSLKMANDGFSPDVQYKADVNLDMTLSEVAKKNSINLNYLKSQLGIPSNIKHDYQLKTISKNFKFDIEDVNNIITQYHKEIKTRIKSNVLKSTK